MVPVPTYVIFYMLTFTFRINYAPYEKGARTG